MNDIKKGIQYAFQTENNMTIAMSGSGHTAMECAVFNTVEPGESVLVAINGIWGERVAEIAERMGASLHMLLHTNQTPKSHFIPLVNCNIISKYLQVQMYIEWLNRPEDILATRRLNR